MHRLLQQVYPITEDDLAFRATLALDDEGRALAFDRLRKDYWPRRDCSAYRLEQTLPDPVVQRLARHLGFDCAGLIQCGQQ